MKIGSVIKDAVILCIVTLVLGLALSFTKTATREAIEKTAEEAKMKAFKSVCTEYNSHENITDDLMGASASLFEKAEFSNDEGVIRCKNADGNIVGYIVQATSQGYGGPLNLIIGFNNDGNITGVAYANTPSETPGLGMKTTKKEFLDNWANHNAENLNEVDNISGATISSTGFRNAVELACQFANKAVELDKQTAGGQ